jgi:hypothetical protein
VIGSAVYVEQALISVNVVGLNDMQFIRCYERLWCSIIIADVCNRLSFQLHLRP